MSLFKKPRRNVRQRQMDSDEEESNKVDIAPDEEDSIASMKASIAKLKEKMNGS